MPGFGLFLGIVTPVGKVLGLPCHLVHSHAVKRVDNIGQVDVKRYGFGGLLYLLDGLTMYAVNDVIS